jgi:putative membrane protein
MPFIIRLVSCGAAILVATWLIPGLRIVPGDQAWETVLTALAVGAVFGLVNAAVQRLVARLSLPMFLRTFGVVIVVTNALVLALTAWITHLTDHGLRIDDVGSAVVGGLVVSVVAFVLEAAALARIERWRDARARRQLSE